MTCASEAETESLEGNPSAADRIIIVPGEQTLQLEAGYIYADCTRSETNLPHTQVADPYIIDIYPVDESSSTNSSSIRIV